MSLTELCEPFFLLICRVHRGARKGVCPTAPQFRAQIDSAINAMQELAVDDPRAVEQLRRIEPILLYFTDSVVRASPLPFAATWANIAAERGHGTSGDEDFFDQLDATLADKSDDATERLSVFYTCLGLGFTGWYRGQADVLRRRMSDIAQRLRGQIESDSAARICPDAYETVNTADLVQPASRKLVGVGIALAGVALTVLIANIVLFREKRGELVRSLNEIRDLSVSSEGVSPIVPAERADGGGRP